MALMYDHVRRNPPIIYMVPPADPQEIVQFTGSGPPPPPPGAGAIKIKKATTKKRESRALVLKVPGNQPPQPPGPPPAPEAVAVPEPVPVPTVPTVPSVPHYNIGTPRTRSRSASRARSPVPASPPDGVPVPKKARAKAKAKAKARAKADPPGILEALMPGEEVTETQPYSGKVKKITKRELAARALAQQVGKVEKGSMPAAPKARARKVPSAGSQGGKRPVIRKVRIAGTPEPGVVRRRGRPPGSLGKARRDAATAAAATVM